MLSSPSAAWATATITIVLGAVTLRNAFAVVAASGLAALPLWSAALAAVWTLGGILLILMARARGASADDGSGPGSARAQPAPVLPAIGTALAIGAGLAAVSFLGGWIFTLIPAAAVWIDYALATAATSAAELTLLAALVAGQAEEVFFRLGLADQFSGHRRWIIPTVLYTLVTCATGNLALIAVAPVAGLAAAWARESTGRWFAPLIVHAVWTLALVGLFPLSASHIF